MNYLERKVMGNFTEDRGEAWGERVELSYLGLPFHVIFIKIGTKSHYFLLIFTVRKIGKFCSATNWIIIKDQSPHEDHILTYNGTMS